jgi:hypothetical protein
MTGIQKNLATFVREAAGACSRDSLGGFTPSEFFAGRRQTGALIATLRDPTTGELLSTITATRKLSLAAAWLRSASHELILRSASRTVMQLSGGCASNND